MDARTLIFLDESHVANRDRWRRFGWSPRGEPALLHEFFSGDRIAASLLACCNEAGFVLPAVRSRICTPARRRCRSRISVCQCQVVHGTIDGDRFIELFQEHILPVLQPYTFDPDNPNPNSHLILDNVSFHWDERLLNMLDAKGVIYTYAQFAGLPEPPRM